MLLALLPVRNGGPELDAWFDNVRDVVDGVVALDDGSTDDTAERLKAEPLVRELLANPSRPDETGWDDRTNRQRLLDAAAALGADWALWLDADERLAQGDGAALRQFVDEGAKGEHAYGFALHDQVAPGRFAPEPKWVYRLHAVRSGDRLPERRLHFPRSLRACRGDSGNGPRCGSSTKAWRRPSDERRAIASISEPTLTTVGSRTTSIF